MLLAPILLAAALAAVYLGWQPPSADLAAQTYRADLFADHGFVVWSNDWYSGFHSAGYSLLFPPLADVLGPRLAGALAVVAAAGLFALLGRRRHGEEGRLGAIWFALGAAAILFSGRLTFALGVAIALAALLAAQRRRAVWAGVLGALTTAASPVAGLFAALAGAAIAIGGERRAGLAVAGGAALAVAALALAFPTAGVEPFVPLAFWPTTAGVLLVLALLPRGERTLRIGVALYALLLLALFLIPNPVGGNATRLGALAAGPVLALALWPRRPLALALAAVPLLYWQWVAPAVDLADAVGDPSVEAAYYAPLVAELEQRAAGEPVRVHPLPTRNRWESVHVAERFPIARGWLRQAESDDFDTFQDGELTPAAYRAWLDERAIAYVAVPDAELDYLAEDEASLIEDGLPYLRPVWSNEHWRLYGVRHPAALVSGPGAHMDAIGTDWFSLTARRPGSHLVRVHFTRYWRVAAGDACVERAGDWTRVVVRAPGEVRVEAPFTLDGLLGTGSSCSG